ncbi:MAG TPA: S-methyl-5-thioribose-1-phosphate isomerase [Usitatibacteraceae bacterium]
MKVHGKARSSIRASETARSFSIIDQTLLPFVVEDHEIDTLTQAAEAIRSMRVRGAPLIGVTAAYGIALAMRDDPADTALEHACQLLQATRPTAVNLAWAIARMRSLLQPLAATARAAAAWQEAGRIAAEDVAANRAIGEHGLTLIRGLHQQKQRPINILTHCNAGWIATVDWGTALAPIYLAHDSGIPVHVWVDETRPRNQGLLTAWELREHGVPHTYIVDNAGGHFMQHGQVDMVLVGADRVSRRGDVANKIGTYLKALAAHDNGIPFYAALPTSTIDWQWHGDMDKIEIEERNGAEIRHLRGLSAHDGLTRDFLLLDENSAVANPAFDVTPARLISGIITEHGIAAPAQLESLHKEKVMVP